MEAVTPATAPAPPARRPRSTKRTRTIEPAAEPEEETAPIPYRSFYVDNATYERFRAATYWTARHPDAVDDPTVAQNMSQAVERFMAATADDLEHRYNRGQPFRIPPKARRRPR